MSEKVECAQMKVFVLMISDQDMRPRCDIMTTAVFATREGAMSAMEKDIASAIESGQISEDEIERCDEKDYASSGDGRLAWKVQEQILNEEN